MLRMEASPMSEWTICSKAWAAVAPPLCFLFPLLPAQPVILIRRFYRGQADIHAFASHLLFLYINVLVDCPT